MRSAHARASTVTKEARMTSEHIVMATFSHTDQQPHTYVRMHHLYSVLVKCPISCIKTFAVTP